ncbi:MAG: hypothetical protein EU544_03190 [Promethearchaeota archaeon]|nr:MAG: hypothetical protein EU544_03190 [Candidatus Lokiarchaeota archaeon]
MSVIIPKKAYYTIVAASVRFANQKIPQEEWLEASGVFVGKNVGKKKKQKVIISEAYPIMHEEYDPEAIVDKYVWSDEDHISLAMIDDEAFAREEFIVGWWHSHPGFKVMLSGFGDRKTTMSYQTSNPLAVSLVFNPLRLIRQVEMPEKKGDPIKQLKNDPGFKIFRLNDPQDSKSNYHEVDFEIEGFESPEQLITQAQKFIVDVTNFFPKDNIVDTYQTFIKNKINELNSLLMGTEEYLKTLVRKGESARVPEVLANQEKEIRKFIAETFIKIENIKEFMDYLEYKERAKVIPVVTEVLHQWDETISKLDAKMKQLKKKF